MSENQVWVVTPTYNRADNLINIYNSLVSQTNQFFSWLIIDDGSKDHTKTFIKQVVQENKLDIHYLHQTNGGKGRALNNAFEYPHNAKVLVIVDSDDILHSNGVQLVYDYLEKYKSYTDIGAFFFYYNDEKNQLLKTGGSVLCEDTVLTRYEYNSRYSQNDGCVCYLDSVYRHYRYPEFDNENYIGPTVLQMMFSDIYRIVFSPCIIGRATYLKGGISKSGRNLRLANPNGMLCYTELMMSPRNKLLTRLKNGLAIWPYGILARKSIFEILRHTKYKTISLIMLFPGVLLLFYWSFYKSRKN